MTGSKKNKWSDDRAGHEGANSFAKLEAKLKASYPKCCNETNNEAGL